MHAPTLDPYFAARTRPAGLGCWEWTLHRDKHGYGRLTWHGQPGYLAHRASYETHVGAIPADMTVDHTCFNTSCVNPAHLRILDRSTNSALQRKVQNTHCANGHPYTKANTYRQAGDNARYCRQCIAARSRRYKARRKAGAQ